AFSRSRTARTTPHRRIERLARPVGRSLVIPLRRAHARRGRVGADAGAALRSCQTQVWAAPARLSARAQQIFPACPEWAGTTVLTPCHAGRSDSPSVLQTVQENDMRRKNRNQHNKAGDLRGLLTDVMLVVSWAALVPGLMWLGGAAGF